MEENQGDGSQQPHVSPPPSIQIPSQPQFTGAVGSPAQISNPPPQTQYIQVPNQPMATTMAPQQVVYIPLNFAPQTNYRTIGYIVLAVGVLLSIILTSLGNINKSSYLEGWGSLVCCGSFIGVVFLDAAYYKSKADWELANGMPNGGSTTSMILEIVFGVILVMLFFLAVIGIFAGA